MRLVKSFWRHSFGDRLLFLYALPIVALIRVALLAIPFSWIRVLFRQPHSGVSFGGDVRAINLAWAVRAAGRVVPGATCLTQALALRFLLGQHGQSSRLQIGVASEGGIFQAHAWVEHAGTVLLNTAIEITPYVRIATWEEIVR